MTSKTLVIAEKPSVAQDIVRALTPTTGKFDKHDEHFENEAWIVTSAVGHLVEIQAPEAFDVKRGKWSFAHLPVIPPYFELKPIDKTKGRLNAIVKLAKRKDVGAVVNACDAGREGELIFRLIEQYTKSKHPVKRLWLQSMTPAAIRDGFDQLRSDQQMLPLADAARCRSEADWLVGINGTRAMTAFNSRDGGFFLTTVGRVQTPTLSVVVEREEKIRKFVSRDYWEIHATFGAEKGQYSGKWFDPAWKKPALADGAEPDPEQRADRLWSEREALAVAQAVHGKPARVTDESKPSTQACALLFDLTSLQREANGKFGFSAKTTLALAQSLYERHKALTYPRTDSRHLPEDYLPVVKQTFEMLADSGMRHLAPHALTALNQGYIKPSKRVFDNSRVSDHFAIIPTTQAPSGLSDAEQKLYDLVVRRFMAIFFPSAEYLVTTRISEVLGHHFKTEGKVLIKPGPRGDRRQGGRQRPAAGAGAARREGAHRGGPGQRPENPAAGPLQRGDAAGRHGGRWQDGRRRRAARGDAGKRPGHPGDPRGHHRRLDQRKIPAARGPRAHPHGQGLPAHDLAAWARRRGALARRSDRRMGVQARAHGKRPTQPRAIHGRDPGHDRKNRGQGQGLRPRHHTGRLRHLASAVPQLRGRDQGKLSPLRLHRRPGQQRGLRFFVRENAGRAHLRVARGRAVPARSAHRPARRISLQGWLALYGRDGDQVRRGQQELQARVRLWRRRCGPNR